MTNQLWGSPKWQKWAAPKDVIVIKDDNDLDDPPEFKISAITL